MIKYISLFVTFLLVGVIDLHAQQYTQYSQYMFNQFAVNPAYAGSRDVLSVVADVRHQWAEFVKEGSPETFSLTVHGPFKSKHIGLGVHLLSDNIGPKKTTNLMGAFAYRIFAGNTRIAMGLRMGVNSYTIESLRYKDDVLGVYESGYKSSSVLCSDAGIYINNKTLYAGLVIANIIPSYYQDSIGNNIENLKPHVMATFSKAFLLNEEVVFNPSIFVKGVSGADLSIDMNANFMLKQKLWLGVSVRLLNSIVFLTQYYISPQFKIGYSYDVALNKMVRPYETHEIMLGYDFNLYKSKVLSPRYL